jgi:hypothetical protein
MRRTRSLTGFVFSAAILFAAAVQAQPMDGMHGNSAASATVSSANSSHGRGIGVGAVTMLNGTSGALVTWGNSGGGFHVDGLVGLHRYHENNTNTTAFSVGGRFWYHVHAAAFADFSLGGGLALNRWTSNPGGPNQDHHLDVSLELGGQIRAFIVTNVALTADLGFGAVFGDNDDILIGSQAITGSGSPNFVVGTLGIAYFFE